MLIDIYVPNIGSLLERQLAPGSAIVGTSKDHHRVLIDYEGNLYGASNMIGWPAKVFHAAGRHVTRSLTSARMLVDKRELWQVGVYEAHPDDDTWCFLELNSPAMLEWWLGPEFRRLPDLILKSGDPDRDARVHGG